MWQTDTAEGVAGHMELQRHLWQAESADVARHREPLRDRWRPDTVKDVARHIKPEHGLWQPDAPPAVQDRNNTSFFPTKALDISRTQTFT